MSRRIITLLFTLISSLTYGQNIEGLEHEYFTTRNSPHAQYQRFTYRYQNIPILEHQYLEIRSLDGNMIKTKSSLSQEARAALNPTLEGPISYGGPTTGCPLDLIRLTTESNILYRSIILKMN